MTKTEIRQLAREHATNWRESGAETGKEICEEVAKKFDLAATSGLVRDYDVAWNMARVAIAKAKGQE